MKKKLFFTILMALLTTVSAWAGPAEEGDQVVGPFYGYFSGDIDFDERETIFGVSYARWIENTWSIEVDVGRPRPDPDFFGSVAAAYHASLFFFPLGIGYTEIEDHWMVQGGAGINLWARRFNFQFQARYLASLDRDEDDTGTWTATTAVRIKF